MKDVSVVSEESLSPAVVVKSLSSENKTMSYNLPPPTDQQEISTSSEDNDSSFNDEVDIPTKYSLEKEVSGFHDNTPPSLKSEAVPRASNTRHSSMPDMSPSRRKRQTRMEEDRRASTGMRGATPAASRGWRPSLVSNLEHSVTDVGLIDNDMHMLMFKSIPPSSTPSKLALQWPPLPADDDLSVSSVSSLGSSLNGSSHHRPEPNKLDVEVRWPPILNRQRSSKYTVWDDESALSGVDLKSLRVPFEATYLQEQEQQELFLRALRNSDESELRHQSDDEQFAEQERNENAKRGLAFATSNMEAAGKEVDDLFRLGGLALPSGQKLPKGSAMIYKRKRRRKKRRTNYRVRYDGPTLLALNEVYGLPSVPEIDNRFEKSGPPRLGRSSRSDGGGSSDSAPKMIRRRISEGATEICDQAPTPVVRRTSAETYHDGNNDQAPTPVRRRSSQVKTIAEGEADCPPKLSRRRSSGDLSREEASDGANDVAPTYLRRRSSRENDKVDQAPTYSKRRSSTRAKDEEPSRGVARSRSADFVLEADKDTAPAPPPRRQSNHDDAPFEFDDEELQSVTSENSKVADGEPGLPDEEGRQRPDVWITPIKREDEDCRWKVKRVWNVESADASEPEHAVHNDDLVDTIRTLLGVPSDYSASELGPGGPQPFYLKIYIDIDGEIEDSGEEISLNEADFRKQVKRMSEIAEVEETLYNDELEEEDDVGGHSTTSHSRSIHSVRAYNRPDLWVSNDQSGVAEVSERKWKVKRAWIIDKDGNEIEELSEHQFEDSTEQDERHNTDARRTEEPEERNTNWYSTKQGGETCALDEGSPDAPTEGATTQPQKPGQKRESPAMSAEVAAVLVVSPNTRMKEKVKSERLKVEKLKSPIRTPNKKKGVKKFYKVKKGWSSVMTGDDDDNDGPSNLPVEEFVWLQK